MDFVPNSNELRQFHKEKKDCQLLWVIISFYCKKDSYPFFWLDKRKLFTNQQNSRILLSSAVQKFFSPPYKPLCIPQLLRLWPTWFAFLLFQTKEQLSNSFANTNLSPSSYCINIWSVSAISSLQNSKCSKWKIA